MSRNRRDARVYGLRATLAVGARRPWAIRRLFYHTKLRRPLAALLSACAAERRPYREVSEEELGRLAKSQHHEGVVLFTEPLEPCPVELPLRNREPLWLALDGVGNDHNIGAIARTMAWFGVPPLIWEGESGHLSGAALRISQGGAEEIARVVVPALPTALQQLKTSGVTLIGADQGAPKSCFDPLPQGPICWVLGNEQHGLSAACRSLCDERRTIPGGGAIESLNVSVSAAVLIAESCRQLGLKRP